VPRIIGHDFVEGFGFLSSLVREIEDVRVAVHTSVNVGQSEQEIYIDEVHHRLAKIPESLGDQLPVVDHLVDVLSHVGYAIVILSNVGARCTDHGATLKNLEVGFWELELYRLLSLKKPIHVIVEKPFDLNRKMLRNVLRILRVAATSIQYVERKDIADAAIRIVRNHARHGTRGLRAWLSALSSMRSTPKDILTEVFDMDLSSQRYDVVTDTCAYDEVRVLIRSAKEQSNYFLALSRLYVAHRELLKIPYWQNPTERDLLLWLEVSGELSRNLMWAGMHGHINQGVIQHLVDKARVAHFITTERIAVAQDPFPSGALASEYYSLDKIMGGQIGRALHYVDMAMQSPYGSHTGTLAIRASCNMRRWHFGQARKDYEEVLRRRRADSTNPHGVGEAMVELAPALLLTGRWRSAFSMAEDGLALMNGEDGFRVRALRKAAWLFRFKSPARARELLAQAQDLALRLGAQDQTRQIND